MFSIQIDTKSLELAIYHQFNNIKLSFFANHMKSSFPLCTFEAVRLLDTLDTFYFVKKKTIFTFI